MNAFCTACGAPRMPLASSSVTLAGQPSKVGGALAKVLGWLVLVGGLLFAGAVAFVFLALEAAAAAGWVGGSIAAVTLLCAWLLLRGGKQLVRSGDGEELAAKKQAIFALANTRGGTLRATDVAQMLLVSPEEGDAILTQLAKQDGDRVGVDIDDDGTVLYRFSRAAGSWTPSASHAGMAPNAPVHVRVAPPFRIDVPTPEDDHAELREDELSAPHKQAR